MSDSAIQLIPELRRDERARERAVHVAHHDHPRGLVLQQDRLEALHDPRGLHCVTGRADPQQHVRGWRREISEERLGHGHVVVLAGMHE